MAVERFPVEAGQILMFARAIGDTSPAYAGALKGDAAVPAPPTFVQASAHYDPEYELRPRPGVPWLGAMDPPDAGQPEGTILHAEQHYEYHRPLLSGTVLHAVERPGATWVKQGRRGGQLSFRELITEFRDADGGLVVTARTVGVQTGRVVESRGER